MSQLDAAFGLENKTDVWICLFSKKMPTILGMVLDKKEGTVSQGVTSISKTLAQIEKFQKSGPKEMKPKEIRDTATKLGLPKKAFGTNTTYTVKQFVQQASRSKR